MRSAQRSRDRVTVGRAHRSARVLGGGRMLHAIRLVGLLVALAFGWRVSLAYLTPCLHGAEAAQTGSRPAKGDGCCPGAERGERAEPPATSPAATATAGGAEDPCGDCTCPIDCAPCCGGAILHALPALAPPPIVAVAVLADLPVPEPSTHRALADPAGILHVPRAS